MQEQINQRIAEFIADAKASGWSRKETRDQLYRINDPVVWARRNEILTALGFAPAPQPQPAVAAPAPQPVTAQPKLAKGEMLLSYPAKDCLTGAELAAGTKVVAVKLGGEWDFTAEPISFRDFKHLREAMLFSLGDEEGGPDGLLDHEDYAILAEYGGKYPHVAAMIGCAVPGLD